MNPAPLILMSLEHISFHWLLHLKKRARGRDEEKLAVLLIYSSASTFTKSFRRLERVLPCKAANDLLKGPLIITGFIAPARLEVSLICNFFNPLYTKEALFVVGLLTAERRRRFNNSQLICLQVWWGSAGCSLNITPSLDCFVLR